MLALTCMGVLLGFFFFLSHYVAGLELSILLFQPPECWDYRYARSTHEFERGFVIYQGLRVKRLYLSVCFPACLGKPEALLLRLSFLLSPMGCMTGSGVGPL
jgi:hypothetical protein